MLFIFILQSFQTIFQSKYISLFIPHLNLKLKISQIFIIYISITIKTINKITYNQLKKLKKKYPTITKPTNKIYLFINLLY